MVKLTKQTDYGIVLLINFARHSPGSVLNAKDLAAETHLPLPMVSKILKALARAHLLDSHRGVKGGYSLTRKPEEISVTEMIVALEGSPIAFTTCVQESVVECTREATCPAMTHWHYINAAVRGALDEVSLADMARPKFAPAPPEKSEPLKAVAT